MTWVGHVQMGVTDAPMKKNKLIPVKRMKKGGGWPKITFVKVVYKNDMSIKEVIKSMIFDMIEWQKGIHITLRGSSTGPVLGVFPNDH